MAAEKKAGLVRRFCVDGRGQIAVRLFLVSVSSSHSIQHADPMVQVDYVIVVE
jgi:hypothetical protein